MFQCRRKPNRSEKGGRLSELKPSAFHIVKNLPRLVKKALLQIKTGVVCCRTKKRVAVYVDGFNLYHAMHNLLKQSPKQKRDHSIKWLDLTKLAKELIGSNDKVVSVNYFSARRKEYAHRLSEEIVRMARKGKICDHKSHSCKKIYDVIERIEKEMQQIPEQSERHATYIEALKSQGVAYDISEFGLGKIPCRCCGKIYPKSIEKQTDIKIALRIISDAYENKFDSLILISEDSDFFPVIEEIVLKHNKEVCVAIVSSVEERFIKKIKKQESNLYKKITIVPIAEQLLQQCQLPDVITLPDGKEIRRPDKYRPPAPS